MYNTCCTSVLIPIELPSFRFNTYRSSSVLSLKGHKNCLTVKQAIITKALLLLVQICVCVHDYYTIYIVSVCG